MLKQDMEAADRKQLKIAQLVELMALNKCNKSDPVHIMIANFIINNIDEINLVVRGR